MNVLSVYNKLLIRKPYRTKCITSFFTFCVGDFLSQRIQRSSDKTLKFDKKRNFKMGMYGFLIAAPFWHVHFNIAIPYLFNHLCGWRKIFKTLLYDQLIAAPIFLTLFFTYNDLVNGKSLKQTYESWKKKFIPTLKNHWKFWGPLQTINFIYIPIQLRVLYSNICGIIWVTYLSYVQYVINKVI
jgi:hypothetical protein